MHIRQIIESDLLKYPVSQKDDSDFLDFITSKYSDYINLLSSISSSDNISKKVKKNISKCKRICVSIQRCIEETYLGKPTKAYEILAKSLNGNISYFRKFYSISLPKKSDLVQRLYRIRLSDIDIKDKVDMFHIPANKRHNVKSQRYSIPSVPCLYFGSSAYIAWCEMDKPDFSKVNIDRFGTLKSTRVVNFAYNPLVMKQNLVMCLSSTRKNSPDIKKLENLVVAWFLFWPLIFACSIRKKEEGSFTPEYIIPQLLLQFVSLYKKERIDGIRYISTKYDKYLQEVIFPSCWAFPAKKLLTKNHCTHLLSLFGLTEVLPWRTANATNQPHDPTKAMQVGGKRSFVNGIFVDYCLTDFGIIEGMLDLMNVSKI